MIDKEIRLQTRQQRHSIQKESNANPATSSQVTQKKPKICSYSNWVKRKKFEERYKYALMMQALKDKHEKELLEQQEKDEKISENTKKIRNWEQQKIIEIMRNKQIKKYKQHEIEVMKQQKRKEAEDNYKQWLRNNMVKLKEEKKQKRLENLKKLQQEKEKEEKAEEIKKQTAENFRKWVKEKKKAKKPSKTSTKNQIKLKKPIMLAYSPNRKPTKEGSSFHEISSQSSETGKDRDYIRKVSSKPNIFNNLNDLSSSHGEGKDYSGDFISESDKIIQESFQDEPKSSSGGEYEEDSEQDYEDSGDYKESDEYDQDSDEYGSDSNDKANNSY